MTDKQKKEGNKSIIFLAGLTASSILLFVATILYRVYDAFGVWGLVGLVAFFPTMYLVGLVTVRILELVLKNE